VQFCAGNLAAIVKMLIFPIDHPNETKKNQIAKFGYSGDMNNQIFGYSVLRVIRTHPNAPKFSDNCPKPFGSLAKKWNLS
jgi:hypothetical protein